MKVKFLSILSGLVVICVGASLVLTCWLYLKHRQILARADALAAEGKFTEALGIYQEAEAQYAKTFLGIPQGEILRVLFDPAVLSLRLAEMEFREGERLLGLYGRVQPASQTLLGREGQGTSPLQGERSDGTSPEDILKRFRAAEEQYVKVQERTGDLYWRFLANANGARARIQAFLINAFLKEQPQDPLGLKQELVHAIQQLQAALNAIYTDQVRVSMADEHSLMLLLEAVTRFKRTPEEDQQEDQRRRRFFATQPEAVAAPLGEILRSGTSLSLSREEQNVMREFLLNQSPGAIYRDQMEESRRRPSISQGLQAGPGSEGKTH